MKQDKSSTNAYLNTVDRIEPDVAMLDRDGSLASIAISLKRIADSLEKWLANDIAEVTQSNDYNFPSYLEAQED